MRSLLNCAFRRSTKLSTNAFFARECADLKSTEMVLRSSPRLNNKSACTTRIRGIQFQMTFVVCSDQTFSYPTPNEWSVLPFVWALFECTYWRGSRKRTSWPTWTSLSSVSSTFIERHKGALRDLRPKAHLSWHISVCCMFRLFWHTREQYLTSLMSWVSLDLFLVPRASQILLFHRFRTSKKLLVLYQIRLDFPFCFLNSISASGTFARSLLEARAGELFIVRDFIETSALFMFENRWDLLPVFYKNNWIM